MEGTVKELPHQRSNMVDLMEIVEIEQASLILPEKSEKVQIDSNNGSRSEEIKSAKSLVQDRTVYKTYFQSVGSLHSGIFLVGGILFAFTLKFPGMTLRITI